MEDDRKKRIVPHGGGGGGEGTKRSNSLKHLSSSVGLLALHP